MKAFYRCSVFLAAILVMSEASGWEIKDELDPLTDKSIKHARTLPKAPPYQWGKPVKTELIIRCGHMLSPVAPEIMVFFSSTVGIGEVLTRWRFDDGPVHSVNLELNGTKEQALFLPNDVAGFTSLSDLSRAKRLRVDVNLPWAGPTLLDFKVDGGSEAVRQIACR